MQASRILVIRLGAMGDILHTLPAVATLKHSFPHCRLSWAVEPRWAALLENNPFVDEVVPVERGSLGAILKTRRRLRQAGYEVAIDFQGLIKSALTAAAARPERIYGLHHSQIRERLAALFYSHTVAPRSGHVVDRNLELAALAGATNILVAFPVPDGKPEGRLPEGDFVLASPLGGWPGKQWPLEHYAELARLLQKELGLTLVLNGPPQAQPALSRVESASVHISGLAGLIDATRRAVAVVGIDSGPLHLAAALGKPGVAVFGPTEPARNGPYGNSITVLRRPGVETTYKRRAVVAESMRQIQPAEVLRELAYKLGRHSRQAGSAV